MLQCDVCVQERNRSLGTDTLYCNRSLGTDSDTVMHVMHVRNITRGWAAF